MYIRDDKQITIGSKIVLGALIVRNFLDESSPNRIHSRLFYPGLTQRQADKRLKYQIQRLMKKGWLKLESKGAKKILKLTEKGKLEALFTKAFTEKKKKWDKKWSIIIFDVPEAASKVRSQLRYYLKKLGFKPLQASVWVSPNDIHSSVFDFLSESKLNQYIRCMRVEKIDNDKDLKKAFNLKA